MFHPWVLSWLGKIFSVLLACLQRHWRISFTIVNTASFAQWGVAVPFLCTNLPLHYTCCRRCARPWGLRWKGYGGGTQAVMMDLISDTARMLWDGVGCGTLIGGYRSSEAWMMRRSYEWRELERGQVSEGFWVAASEKDKDKTTTPSFIRLFTLIGMASNQNDLG